METMDGCPSSATMEAPLMNPRKPHLPPHLRQHLIDPEEPGVDFAGACADCGCTSCCVDLDTVDDQRQARRAAHVHSPRTSRAVPPPAH